VILLNRTRKREALLSVLRAADRGMSGYELAKAARLSRAFVYLELTRLLADGTVRDWWGGRQRFYELTDRSSS
jgi:Fe2+ or Zn2+ uptake regulation protein